MHPFFVPFLSHFPQPGGTRWRWLTAFAPFVSPSPCGPSGPWAAAMPNPVPCWGLRRGIARGARGRTKEKQVPSLLWSCGVCMCVWGGVIKARSGVGGGGTGTCLSAGGGVQGRGVGGPGGSPPPLPEHTQPTRKQKIYCRMKNSAHGNVMLSAVNNGNSSLHVNSGFPNLTNAQQQQQSGAFIIICQMTVISQN